MKKLYYLDIDLYRYFIGREDQSVSQGEYREALRTADPRHERNGGRV